MKKILRYSLLAGLLLCLLTLGACNLPSIVPAEDTPGTSEPDGVDPSTPPTPIDGAALVYVPGGSFQMGSPADDPQADNDEFPQHSVAVGSFWVYTREVTNAMYAACVWAGGCDTPHISESGPTSHYTDPACADFPVVGVDWNMAYNYCHWAGGRLPTEAEWEYAARGTESLPYPWGEDEPACSLTNILGCFTPPEPLAVGSFPEGISPFELLDMAGNVWEWVNDWYAEDYYLSAPAANPVGPMSGEEKVVHGGGWMSAGENVRAANRVSANLYLAYDDVGFRCVPVGETVLPDDLDVPEDRHESVPPDSLDGSESVEDPDDPEGWWWTWSRGSASCPDESGLISVAIPVEASILQEYTLASGYSGDVPFDCTYNATEQMLRCVGPEPEVTEGDPFYHFLICAEEFGSCNFVDVWRMEVLLMGGCAASNPGNNVSPELACWVGPSLRFNYRPVPPVIVSVTSGGEPLNCWYWNDEEYGLVDCTRLPGEPGSELPVTACYDNGECFDQTIIVPRCEEAPDDEGTEPHGFWALLDVGCHSETQIHVLFDTPFPDLVPGVSYDYAVSDGETTYTCELHPTIPGRMYCSGIRPADPGPLEVCISVNGAPQSCTTFDEFPGMVPSCLDFDAEEPDQPEQTTTSCSDYDTMGSCISNDCQWHLPPPTNPGGTGYCTNP